MTLVWIVLVGLAIVALASRMAWSPKRRETGMGFVSHQWLAEHRSSDMSDRPR